MNAVLLLIPGLGVLALDFLAWDDRLSSNHTRNLEGRINVTGKGVTV